MNLITHIYVFGIYTDVVKSNCINENNKIKQGTGFSGSFFAA